MPIPADNPIPIYFVELSRLKKSRCTDVQFSHLSVLVQSSSPLLPSQDQLSALPPDTFWSFQRREERTRVALSKLLACSVQMSTIFAYWTPYLQEWQADHLEPRRIERFRGRWNNPPTCIPCIYVETETLRVFKDVQIIPHNICCSLYILMENPGRRCSSIKAENPQLCCLCFDWTISMSKLFLSSFCVVTRIENLCCKSVFHTKCRTFHHWVHERLPSFQPQQLASHPHHQGVHHLRPVAMDIISTGSPPRFSTSFPLRKQ